MKNEEESKQKDLYPSLCVCVVFVSFFFFFFFSFFSFSFSTASLYKLLN